MKLKKLGLTAAGVALALGVGFTATLSVGQMAPFGNDEDTSYAASLWTAMVDANMAAKGNASGGCITCHSAEADYLYTTNAIK